MRKYRFVFFVALSFMGCSPKNNQGDEKNPVLNEMPAISLQMISGEIVMANSLPGNSILIFFGPDCDHCQRQAEDIRLQMETFNEYSLYFIASNPKNEIAHFAETYRLQGNSNIFFAKAEVAEVIRILGPMNVPTILIFSSERRLVKKFDVETSVNEIAKYL